MEEPTVDTWVPAAMRGEPEALDALIRHFRPAVYLYCRAHMPDDHTADDVTQEVMMAVVRALPRHRIGEHAITAYVFGIATKQVAMAHRTAYRRREVLTSDPPDHVAIDNNPDRIAERRETQLELRTLLGALTRQQRE